MSVPRRATYRIQLGPGFDLDDTAAAVPYLARLGISHLQLSPVLEAVPGSTHGYDVVDHSRVSDALGGDAAFAALADTAAAAGMGLCVDTVPNHMAASGHGQWWWSVLRDGADSPYAGYFDIDWESVSRQDGRLHVPMLDASSQELMERGDLRVQDGVLAYGPERFPLSEHYLLVDWREAARRCDYRRFFDVNGMVAVAVDRDDVFDAVHARLAEWVSGGLVDGVRVDHVDGLRDPAAYLARLSGVMGARGEGDGWIVVEKILGPDEDLPPWPVAGTTGYDFLARVGALFVDPAGGDPLRHLFAEFTGELCSWDEVAVAARREVLHASFTPELERVVARFEALWAGDHSVLTAAVAELVVALDVYRTYEVAGQPLSQGDLARIEAAAARAAAAGADAEALACVLSTFGGDGAVDPGVADAVARLQMLAVAVMAKGVEDTALYRWFPLAALCEVGVEPDVFGTSVQEFHDACELTRQRWPETMLAVATHDTKRSGDVRARLALLAEIPQQWADAVRRWSAANAASWGRTVPDRRSEYLLYQTLVGAWPLDADRALRYMTKAAREAKLRTSWVLPDTDFEAALESFVRTILADDDFVADLAEFCGPLVAAGRANAVAQALLHCTAPGVPDIYQGAEVWDLRLVDPDNRTPVEFARLDALLEECDSLGIEEIVTRVDDGLPKLWTIRCALDLRRRRPDLFAPGATYEPLAVSGPRSDHVVAYCRGGAAVTAVARFPLRLAGPEHLGFVTPPGRWEDTSVNLPPGEWRNVLTGDTHEGGPVPMADLLARFPVALLER